MREQPFYRRSNDSWYVQFGKKQVRLAKGKANRADAYRRFAGLKQDRPLRRERLLHAGERKFIFESIPDPAFRQYLFALQESGARPGEVRKLSREHVNLQIGAWVFQQHKTKGKTGRPRVVYLTPAMLELTKDLLRRQPDGPLFRNSRGEPWTKDAVVQRMDALRAKFPRLQGVVAY